MYSKSVWLKYENHDKIFDFAEGYKDFLNKAKSERLAVKEAIKIAESKGFKPLDSFTSLKAGDKVYAINRGKNFAAFIIGEKDIEKGINILGAHIDSPRMDIKQNPLYEASDSFAYLDTHYYGGIKTYQYVTIPLALVGVIAKKDGTVVEVNIGNDPKDPVLGISDLLIHLSKDQMMKSAGSAIEGENLDVTVGSIPLKGEEKTAIKANVLKILKDKYGVEEEDFLSSEIEVVPAFPVKDYGLDRSMIAGYGQDDRVCAYTSLMALVDTESVEKTSCAYLVDKEEIGSVGATGAQSRWFEDVLAEMLEKMGKYSELILRRILTNSKMLSSDVSAGVDPLYIGVNELKNSCFLGKGIVFNKYTGRGGKGGCNDASAEYIGSIRKIMDEADIYYQTAEIGRVDAGGGGTIAYIFANTNMDVIDAGVPVLNMHSPMEISSKADVFEAYEAYKVFVKNM